MLEIEVDTLTKEIVAGVYVCACVYVCAWLVSVLSCVCVFVSGACTGVDRKARVACVSILNCLNLKPDPVWHVRALQLSGPFLAHEHTSMHTHKPENTCTHVSVVQPPTP